MSKKPSALSTVIKSMPVPDKVDKKVISHSQYTIYNSCPYQWSLRYIHKIKPFTSTINTVFGTAMHEVLQEYLKTMYETSIRAADAIDIDELLLERFKVNYSQEVVKNNGEDFTTPDEFFEFYDDGLQILHWFKSHRDKFFSVRGWELLGIEIPIMMPTATNPNVYFNGFIDIVMGSVINDKVEKIFVYDFKTSKMGWKDDREKKDTKKIAQILLYKKYFSKQYEISEDMVEVVFFILKRKIWEGGEFPIPRVQVFRPASGTAKVREAEHLLSNFVNECFTEDGEYNTERYYEKTPSSWSCRFCPFAQMPDLCDQKA